MNLTIRRNAAVFASAATLAVLANSEALQAQSSDALLDKLVEKGILSAKEANELRDETDKDFNRAFSAKTGMPDWVTALRFNGDLRGRAEGFSFDNPGFPDRMRYRYRLRFGVVAVLKDNFEVGLRFGSGDLDGGIGSGIDPISQNQTLQNNASKKGLFIDLAYAKWTPLNRNGITDTLVLGKMENPFVVSDMIFDGDYTPEGVANTFAYALNSKHSLKLNLGAFVLDEIGSLQADPYLLGAQARWDAAWSPKWASTVAVAGYSVENHQNLGNATVPNLGAGNSRDATGNLLQSFNSIAADAAITYTLDKAPFYAGAFPVRAYGEWMHNLDAASAEDGWTLGITFGKSGKRGTWAADYRYKWLEGDFWFEEFSDSDFGALYPTAAAFAGASGKSPGYSSGTGVEGHVFTLSYSPYDSLTFQGRLWLTELVHYTGPESSDSLRFQLDAVWKF